MKKTLLLTTLFCLSLQAQAEIKPYIGIDYTYTKADLESAFKSLKDNYNAGSVYMGTKLHKNFGIEVFYQKSDTKRQEIAETEFKAYGADAIGYLPLNQQWELLGSVGAGKYHVKMKDRTGLYPVLNTSENEWGYRFGLGTQYNLTDNWSFKTMGHYVLTNQLDSVKNLLQFSVGLQYNF